MGLGGSVWGDDAAKAAEIAARLECGTAWVNQHAGLHPMAPFGGVKCSGIGVEFNVDGLLRGDIKSRSDYYIRGRQWGWLSANDIRALENMDPIDNGDVYLSPLNMVQAGDPAADPQAEPNQGARA